MAGTVTVYAYGNSDALHGIFNAIAMIMGGDDYKAMINIALVIGFLTVGVLAMAPTGINKSWNWFISVAVLNGILLVPKTEVVIEDRLGLRPAVAIDNVPWTIGLLASVKSSVGATLTELFETSFQTIPSSDRALPAELAYLNTGVMFGNRLIKGSREAGIHDPNGNADLLSYMRSCVFPEYEYGGLAANTQKSTKLIDLMSDPNPAMIVAVHNAAGDLDTMRCDQAWTLLQPRMTADGGWADQAFRQLAAKSFPDRAIGDAMLGTESALVAAYGKAKLADATMQARDIMIQNIMINATADAAALHSAALDDPAMLTLAAARSQAVSQMNAGFLTQGRIAEEALPLVRNVVEAIIYALFPIICLVAIASEGQALKTTIKGYLMVMLWVELWPPMFAIVNYLQTLASAANLGAAGVMSGAQGLSLETAGAVFGTAVSDLSVASWMVTFVPVIAGAALFGMNQLVSALGGGKPGAAAADSAAGQATKGNMSMGQFSTFNQPADVVANPFMRTQIGVGGSSTGDVRGGARIDNYAESSTLVSLSDQAGWQRQSSEARSDALRQSRTDSQNWSQSIDAALNGVESLVKSGALSKNLGDSLSTSQVANSQEMQSDTSRMGKDIAERFNIGDSSGVSKAISATISAGGKVPLTQIGAAVQRNGESVDAERLGREIAQAATWVQDRQTSRQEALVKTATNSEEFRSARSSNREATSRVDSQLSEGVGFREQAAQSLERARSHELTERKIAAFGMQGVTRWANEIADFFRANGQDPGKGIASTAEQKRLLKQFIERGDVIGEGGNWVPDLGQGPNIPQDRLGFDRKQLQADYAWGGQAGGGEAGVRAFAASGTGRVNQARQAAGVAPTQAVAADELGTTVSTQQSSTAERVQQEERAQGEARGDAALRLQERGKSTSRHHSSDAIKPLQTKTPFDEEARDAAVRRDERTAENYKALSKAVKEVPGAKPD